MKNRCPLHIGNTAVILSLLVYNISFPNKIRLQTFNELLIPSSICKMLKLTFIQHYEHVCHCLVSAKSSSLTCKTMETSKYFVLSSFLENKETFFRINRGPYDDENSESFVI